MKRNPVEIDMRRFYGEFKPATRATMRSAWRSWTGWCAGVNVEPLKATFPDAQAWVDSLAHRGLSPRTVESYVRDVKLVLEYLAMLGHRPNEPHRHVSIPELRGRPVSQAKFGHVVLDDTLVAGALYASRGDPRANLLLWLAAGMGLNAAEIAAMRPSQIRTIGATSVTAVHRGGRAHLIPIPREVLLLTADGWPVKIGSPDYVRHAFSGYVNGYIETSARELREWHRQCALRLGVDAKRVAAGMSDAPATGLMRWSFSSHPAAQVCAHIRALVLAQLKE